MPEYVNQSLPFEVSGDVRRKAGPFASLGLGAVSILRNFDLTSLVIPTRRSVQLR